MIVYLSYALHAKVPAYGKTGVQLELEALRSFETGDTCRVYRMAMENHWGTHVDCPGHFFVHGNGVTDYAAGFWLFRKPQVMAINAVSGQLINKGDLPGEIEPGADLLLLHSGWSEHRGNELYSLKGPGLSAGLGFWLRKNYPGMRAVGIDWVSASSFLHRESGRDAHRAFLDPDGEGDPILIVEDMFLPEEGMDRLSEVWVVPLRVNGIDSAPCTVLGVFK